MPALVLSCYRAADSSSMRRSGVDVHPSTDPAASIPQIHEQMHIYNTCMLAYLYSYTACSPSHHTSSHIVSLLMLYMYTT